MVEFSFDRSLEAGGRFYICSFDRNFSSVARKISPNVMYLLIKSYFVLSMLFVRIMLK
jgi:hypothetical protein